MNFKTWPSSSPSASGKTAGEEETAELALWPRLPWLTPEVCRAVLPGVQPLGPGWAGSLWGGTGYQGCPLGLALFQAWPNGVMVAQSLLGARTLPSWALGCSGEDRQDIRVMVEVCRHALAHV